MMQQPYDVVVIGGGAVGSAIARELSRYRLRIAVVERAHSAGGQAGGRATGLLHAGVLYRPGTLKAVCAVEGSQEFDAVAAELDVPFRIRRLNPVAGCSVHYFHKPQRKRASRLPFIAVECCWAG